MGVGDLIALVDVAHVGVAGLAMGSAICFLTTQDARVRGDSHDKVSMEPTIYGQLATTMTIAVSRMHATPDGDDGDNEPVWLLELASSWARSNAAWSFHALAESEPLITIALAMLPPQRPTVARVGCVAEARSNTEHITRSLDCLPSLIPFYLFAEDISPKLQADIGERVNLLRFAKLAPTYSTCAWPGSRRFVSRLGHSALAFLASGLHASGRLSELCNKFPKHYDAVFRVAVCRIFRQPSSRILSSLRSLRCASCHLLVQARRSVFASAGDIGSCMGHYFY
jgi:hypothetical protein